MGNGLAERRHSGFYMKNWHVALLTIVLLATIGASILFGQYKSAEAISDIKDMKPKINYLEKCIEVDREKHQGEYNLLNNKIQNIHDKLDDADDKMDKIIEAIEKISDSAIILTQPLKKENS